MAEELNILTDAVSDIDDRTIAPAGAAVGRAMLKTVGERGLGTSPRMTVSEAGILPDFEAAVNDPGLALFFDNDLCERTVTTAARIAFSEPLFRELEALRRRDPLLYAHSVATAALTIRVTMEIVMKADDLARIGGATLVKDLGMTRIPRPQTGKQYLSKQQFHQIRKHPVIGLVLLTHYLGEGIEGMVALRHHMRNGSGYPRWGGLKPSKLIDLIEAVDVFYALISPRSFRPEPFDARGAIDELTQMAEQGQISRDSVRLLVMCLRQDRPDLGQVDLSSERQGFVPRENFYGTG